MEATVPPERIYKVPIGGGTPPTVDMLFTYDQLTPYKLPESMVPIEQALVLYGEGQVSSRSLPESLAELTPHQALLSPQMGKVAVGDARKGLGRTVRRRAAAFVAGALIGFGMGGAATAMAQEDEPQSTGNSNPVSFEQKQAVPSTDSSVKIVKADGITIKIKQWVDDPSRRPGGTKKLHPCDVCCQGLVATGICGDCRKGSAVFEVMMTAKKQVLRAAAAVVDLANRGKGKEGSSSKIQGKAA